ncbi:hypothetical protein AB0B44_36260, partial [Streptomyces sp. NPDC041003]
MSDVEKGGFISKVIGPKKRWRAYKARVKELPENQRTAVEAIERYLMRRVRQGFHQGHLVRRRDHRDDLRLHRGRVHR